MVAPVPMGATGMRKRAGQLHDLVDGVALGSRREPPPRRRVAGASDPAAGPARGRRPRSGRSIITVKSCHCCALSMANPTQPSQRRFDRRDLDRTLKTWRMKWSRSPVSEACSGSNGLSEIDMHSRAETSTWSPRPVASGPPPGCEAADGGQGAGDPVAELAAGGHGGRSGGPRPPMEPDSACSVNSVAGRSRPRPGLAERGDGDDGGRGSAARRSAGRGPSGQRARAGRLDQEIGRPRQVEERGPARLRREVGDDAALAGVEERGQRRVVPGRRRAPERPAAAGSGRRSRARPSGSRPRRRPRAWCSSSRPGGREVEHTRPSNGRAMRPPRCRIIL